MRFAFLLLLVVALLPDAIRAQAVYMDNVVVVLDCSGSMADKLRGGTQTKIEAAKGALREVLKTLPPTTQVGLLVFGGLEENWVYPLGPRDDARLAPVIKSLSAGGGTPLGAYMKTGADRLLEARAAQYGYGSYRLLVITDGEASDQYLVDGYTPDILSRGIILDAIGVDMAQDHTLARTAHSYRRANDPEALKRAVQEVFAEVGREAGDLSGESAFAELAGFDPELALSIIQALRSSGNDPIGAQQAASEANGPGAMPGSSQGKKGGSNFWVIVIVAAVAILALRGKKKRRK